MVRASLGAFLAVVIIIGGVVALAWLAIRLPPELDNPPSAAAVAVVEQCMQAARHGKSRLFQSTTFEQPDATVLAACLRDEGWVFTGG